MALLKDLTVFGATNLISDTFANHIFANGYHHNAHNNDDAVLLAGGGWQSLANLSSSHTHPYLPLAGGDMTGTIHRTTSSTSNTPVISLHSPNLDSWIWRVRSADTGTKTSESAAYGYGLKYIGTGTGVANLLRLYADNQTSSTTIIAFSINQNGQVGIGADASTNYRLYVNGNANITTSILSPKHLTANYEISEAANNRLSFGSANQSMAKGINVGDLLVSNAWADYTKVPTNGIYSKGVIRSGVTSGAPFTIASTGLNTNLNADLLDGCHADDLRLPIIDLRIYS